MSPDAAADLIALIGLLVTSLLPLALVMGDRWARGSVRGLAAKLPGFAVVGRAPATLEGRRDGRRLRVDTAAWSDAPPGLYSVF